MHRCIQTYARPTVIRQVLIARGSSAPQLAETGCRRSYYHSSSSSSYCYYCYYCSVCVCVCVFLLLSLPVLGVVNITVNAEVACIVTATFIVTVTGAVTIIDISHYHNSNDITIIITLNPKP